VAATAKVTALQVVLHAVISPRLHHSLSSADPAAATRLQQFLVDWLAYHILGSDQDLARQIEAIDAGTSPDEAYRTRRRARDPATSTLLHSLDRLFHHVSERNRELMAWNQTLEARVAERTRELSLANQRLEQQAMTDVLTGLANRRHAMQCLQAEWPNPAEPGRSLACVMVDADGLKGVNDIHGHGAQRTAARPGGGFFLQQEDGARPVGVGPGGAVAQTGVAARRRSDSAWRVHHARAWHLITASRRHSTCQAKIAGQRASILRRPPRWPSTIADAPLLALREARRVDMASR
jgi:hypothetical protein